MSGFEVGEVVRCVGPLDDDDGARGMFIGSFYRIADIGIGESGPHLNFAGISAAPWRGWAPPCFRKLPRADADFTATIRACRPVKVGEVA